MAEISELGNGEDPVRVPNRRQDWMQQPRQGAASRPGCQSVEFGYSGSAEMANDDWLVRSDRQRNPEAPVPQEVLPWVQLNWASSGGQLAQNEDPPPPHDKAAAA